MYGLVLYVQQRKVDKNWTEWSLYKKNPPAVLSLYLRY